MACPWLHRLWQVEDTIVNQQLLPPDLYPEREHDNREELVELTLRRKTEFHPDNLALERQILQRVLSEITVESLPQRKSKGFKTDWEAWKREAQCLLEKSWKEYSCRAPSASTLYSKEAYLEACRQRNQTEAQKGSAWHHSQQMSFSLSYGSIRSEIADLHQACQHRLAELDRTEADVAARRQLAIAARAMPQESDRLARYKRHITRTLHQALDQLALLRQQRSDASFIGSFGQATQELPSSS